jgi:hypothetical protein
VGHAEEAGPSRQSEELVLEQTAPLPGNEASNGVVRVEGTPLHGEAQPSHG